MALWKSHVPAMILQRKGLTIWYETRFLVDMIAISNGLRMQVLGRKGGQGVLATAADAGGPIFFEFTLAEGLELETSSYLLRNGSRSARLRDLA